MEPKLLVGWVRSTGARALVLLGHYDGATAPPNLVVRASSMGVPVQATVTVPPPDADFDPPLRRQRVLPLRVEIGPVPNRYLRIEVVVGALVAVATEVEVIPDVLPPEGFTVAAATCFYDYFAGGASSYGTALRLGRWFGKTGLAILAGDNLYMDVAPDQRSLDDPYEEAATRYAKYFVYGAYPDAIGAQPTVMTWDDHEFWNNYPEFQPHLSRTWSATKRMQYSDAALAGIQRFQAPLNPPGVGGAFQFDVAPLSFFVADLRTGRTPRAPSGRSMLSAPELDAMVQWLRGLKGPGVLVIGQPLWIEKGDWRDWNPPAFESEYAALWSALADAPYDVMILSGDVHHSRALALRVRGRDVFEVVTSPAVHIPTKLSTATGSYATQDTDPVEYPGTVEVDPSVMAAPELRAFLFGHAEPNTLAFLHFRPAGPDRVDVSLAFVDHRTGDIAPSTSGGPCYAAPALSLRKR